MKNANSKSVFELLQLSGETAELARLNRRPLLSEQRDAISEARLEARKQGFSQAMITRIENEGRQEVRS